MSDCPVDNFADAYPLLRRPFTPAAVRFKVQATWETGALIVAYIDARLASGRLNHVIPHKWSSTFEPVANGLLCRLTVDGITREDIGSDYVGKGLYSDALKRAAVHFGVAESLYVLPKMTLSEGNLLRKKRVKGKDTMILTPQGEIHCRKVYESWLETVGVKAFGEPLDHGDVIHDEPDEAPEPRPLDEIAALLEEHGLSEDERAALREWIKEDRERIDTVLELLREPNLAALRAGMEFDAVIA